MRLCLSEFQCHFHLFQWVGLNAPLFIVCEVSFKIIIKSDWKKYGTTLVLSDSISVQNVCKVYQQTTRSAISWGGGGEYGLVDATACSKVHSTWCHFR